MIVETVILFHTGNRTLAVVTKLDLMDHGTDAMDILYGRGKNYGLLFCVFFSTNFCGKKASCVITL